MGYFWSYFDFWGWGSTPQIGSDAMTPFADWLISWKEGAPRPGPEKAPGGPKMIETGPGHTVHTRGYLQPNRFYELLTFITAKLPIFNRFLQNSIFNIFCIF